MNSSMNCGRNLWHAEPPPPPLLRALCLHGFPLVYRPLNPQPDISSAKEW